MADVVRVQVVADANQAKQQLQELQAQLKAISATPINVNNASLVEANKAALELQQTLSKATNPNTGKLDLSVFSRELQKSGQDLASYQSKLASIGPAGSQAFLSLSKAIATAEAPTNRLNAKLVKFGQTIKNTINWQISSSIIHSVMGQFQSAINYAEKLNTSLTNIKIVTGANSDQMAQFAQQANEAARRLSTTTTAYSNASLIFFQQGLKGDDVTKRADVVIKLANVTGESAQEVSNQMTAIWNNFAEGSDNLEHYADVITALGAATASSSKEIATGLEKFAAIANTVGLSYENATAALATITATTRQSADTVGTGLRTVFSRLESLKLGETLEDGVGLTKYTKALDTVGVKALDATGELRDMNDVLADLGERWTVLSRAQQMALAQTIGGVRQYATIMALMENFDKYEKNLSIAENADGTLQQQQESYETGWVAASKRVRASLENIYSSVIDDSAIIKIMDGFSQFLDIINDVINGLGGIQGILLMIGSLVTNKFAKDLPMVFQSIMTNVKNFIGIAAKEMVALQNTNQQVLQSAYTHGQNAETDVELAGLMEVNAMNQKLAMNRHRMTEQEIADYTTLMANTSAYYDTLKPLAKTATDQKAASNTNAADVATHYAFDQRKEDLNQTYPILAAAQKRIKDYETAKQEYVQDYLKYGSQMGMDELTWDSFIAEQMKARNLPSETEYKALKEQQHQIPYTSQLDKADKAINDLMILRRESEDHLLQELELEKTNLESQAPHSERRRELLHKQNRTQEEEAELTDLNLQLENSPEMQAINTKIQERKQFIASQVQSRTQAASASNLLNNMVENGGAIQASLIGQRQRNEIEALQGVNAAARKQGAWAEIGSTTAKQAGIWSADKIGKMSPQQQADVKAQMLQYANAIKTTMTENGLGDLFSGELDPIQQLKDRLENGDGDLSAAFQEFFQRITGEGDTEASNAGQRLAGKLAEGVDKAADQAEGITGNTPEAKDAIRTIVSQGYDAGTAGAKAGIATHMGAPGGKQDPTHKFTAVEGIAKAASAAMMLVSSLKAAENTASSWGNLDKPIDKVSSALGTVASTAMSAGQMMSLAASMSLGPWGMLLGAIIAVITAWTGVQSGISKAKTEETKKTLQDEYIKITEEQEKAAQKHISIEEFDSLYQAYEKLAKGSEEAISAQDGLIEKAKEVAEAYKDVNLYLAAVNNNLEKITELMDQTEIQNLQKTKFDAESAQKIAETNLGLTLGESTFRQKFGFGGVDKTSLLYKYVAAYNPDLIETTTHYQYNIDGQPVPVDADALTPEFGYTIGPIDKETGKYPIYYQQGNYSTTYYATRTAQSQTSELTFKNTIEDYEKALKLQKDLQDKYKAENKLNELGEDSGYQQLVAYLTKGQEYYEAYKEQSDLILQTDTKLKILQDGIYNTTTLSTYQAARDKLIKSLAQEQGLLDDNGDIIKDTQEKYDALIDVVDDVLKTTRIGNTAKTFGWLNSFAQEKGYDIDEVTAEYDKIIKEYGQKEGNALFLKIMPKIVSSDGTTDLATIIAKIKEEAQLELAQSDLELRISVVQDFKKLNGKSDTTTEAFKSKFDEMSDDDLFALAKAMGLDSVDTYNLNDADGRANRLNLLTQLLGLSAEDRNAVLNQTEANILREQKTLLPQQIEEATNKQSQLQTDIQNSAIGQYVNNEAVMKYLTARQLINEFEAEHGADENLFTPEELEEYAHLTTQLNETANALEGNENSVFDITDTELQNFTDLNNQLEQSKTTLQELQDKQNLLTANGFRDELKLEAEQWGINYDEVQAYASALRDGEHFQADQIEEAEQFALAQKKVSVGIELISKNLKTYQTELKAGKKGSDAYKQSLEQIRKGLSGILGLPVGTITDDFIEAANDAGILADVMNDVEGAVDKVYSFMGERNLAEALGMDTDVIAKLKPEELHQQLLDYVSGGFEGLGDALQTIYDGLPKFNPGDLINTPEMTSALDTAVQAMFDAGNSITDVINWLSSQGVEANIIPAEAGGEGTFDAEATGVHFVQSGADIIPQTGNTITYGTSQATDITAYSLEYRKKGGGGSGGKGGGGGGGKKEPHKPKRYRNIENQIQNNKRKTDTVSRNKDRAVGTAKLEYLEKERELREENLKLEQQYQKEIEDWLDKDRDKMMEAFAAINFTPIFDEAGEVINNDAFELAFEAIGDGSDEAWKKAEEALAQYEETLDKLNDKLEEIQELQDAIYDAALEATKLKLDLQLNVSIDRFEYLDYLLDKIDDDAYQAAEAIALLGDKTAETMKKVNTYTTGLEDILSRHGFSLSDLDNLSVEDLNAAGFTQSEIDQIKEWRSELLKANQDLLEMRKTIIDKVVNAFDDLNEKVQKSYDKFDAYNSVLEKYKNITDLMGRNMSAQSRQIMNQLSNTMLRNAQNTAAAARRIYENAEMEMAQAQLAYQLAVSSGDQEAIRRWQEVIDATSEHLQEAEEQWLESWNNALEQAKTMFEDMMEQIQEDYSATMGSTFGSLDYLQAAYDRQKEIGEMYERDFDRLYDLSKLSHDISKAIDDNDNIQGKQKLRALQAEINKLQADGTRLSEYDVEVLRKKFELEQARLALDDAQNAKSQVRLQRDANGNWGYVYTANEDKIAEAEQAYEDKLHEYQVLNDDYINQLQDKALEVQQTWSEVVGEIYSDLGLGVITDEEAAARLEEANQWLNEQRAYFEEQSNHALENQASLYDRTLNTYHVASAEIVDTWGETNLALLTKIDELQTYMNNWNEASETFLSHSAEVIDKYKEDIDKINDMAGISTTKFENHIDNVVVNINDMSDDTLTSVNDLSETMRNEFSSALSEAVNWELQYVNAMDAMINRNETFVKSLNLMIEKLAGVNTSITEMLTPLETLDNIINQSTTPVYYQNSLSELTGTSAQHILSLLNANIAAYSAGLGQLSNPMINGLSTTIDQNVTITASFPNATNHSEIEEAFTNLINKASQYANRKGY